MSDTAKKSSNSALRIAGILFLSITLIIIGSLVALYFTITKGAATIDDPAALADQTPMPASSRFDFDTASETAQIRLDKSDLWWLALPEMDEDFLETANHELEPYQLHLNGYGLNITEDGIIIDLEAMYRSVRLPVHILTDLDFDASGFSLTLTKAKLGPLPLPTAGLLSSVNLQIDADWPVITDITEVSYHPDAVVLTGTVTQDMLSWVRESCQNDTIGWFSSPLQEVFRVARKEDGFRELLPGLEQDPGSVETLYYDLFILAEAHEYEAFMDTSRNLSHRFFPGIDYSGRDQEYKATQEQWMHYDSLVDQLVTQVSTDFNNRRFRLKDGEFYLGKSTFDVLNYITDDSTQQIQELFNLIDPDKFQLILVGSINGYAVDSPALNKICDKSQPLTQKLDRKAAYPVGCVFQGLNGEYFLRYESMKLTGRDNKLSKWLKSIPITEAEYQSLIQEGQIGVWIS